MTQTHVSTLRCSEQNDEEAKITAWTVARIREVALGLGQGQVRRPFFSMLGHHRPHLPWHAPRRFFDRLPPIEATAPAAHPELPLGAVALTWKPWVGAGGRPPGNESEAWKTTPVPCFSPTSHD